MNSNTFFRFLKCLLQVGVFACVRLMEGELEVKEKSDLIFSIDLSLFSFKCCLTSLSGVSRNL